MKPVKESVLTPLETPVTVPPDSRQAPNVTFPPDRIETATLPALAERIEAWVKAWVASEKPPEYLLDILEEEFARVKAEYEVSVKRLREAKPSARRPRPLC